MPWGKPYTHTRWRGEKFNYRTKACLVELEDRLGTFLNIYQGSFSTSVSASGGTHAGGGAVDLWTSGNPIHVENVARRLGIMLYHRVPSEGPWAEHYHGIVLGDRDMSVDAKWQVDQYIDGLNALSSRLEDDNPYNPVHIFRYFAWRHKLRLRDRMRRLRHAGKRFTPRYRKMRREFKRIQVVNKHPH